MGGVVLFYSLSVITLICLSFSELPGQKTDSVSNSKWPTGQQLVIGVEYRPRAELRYGYRQLPADTSAAAFHSSHRGRINLDYSCPRFTFHFALQDIRVWGEEDPKNDKGWLQLHECYAEPSLNDHLSLRIGRQEVSYDNQRLFSANDWRQSGSKHDAVRIIYKAPFIESDLIGAFNQNDDRLFETFYSVPWDNYKVLLAHFMRLKLYPSIGFTAINFMDGYQRSSYPFSTYFKYTNGGRIDYTRNNLYLTLASYYQHGKTNAGEKLKAYYFEQEIRIKTSPAHTFRLGGQLLSGDNEPTDGISKSFLILYGSVHSHNGRMDYTHKIIPANNHPGVINPYLIQDFKLKNNLAISWESHCLSAQRRIHTGDDPNGGPRFIGWENDFRCLYKANDFTAIEVSYMFFIPGKALALLPGGKNGDLEKIPQFAFVQVDWNPEILRSQEQR